MTKTEFQIEPAPAEAGNAPSFGQTLRLILLEAQVTHRAAADLLGCHPALLTSAITEKRKLSQCYLSDKAWAQILAKNYPTA